LARSCWFRTRLRAELIDITTVCSERGMHRLDRRNQSDYRFKPTGPRLAQRRVAVKQLREELRAFKDQISGGATKLSIWGGVPLSLAPLAPVANSLAKLDLLTTMPDLRYSGRPQMPAKIPTGPATASLPAAIKEELPAPVALKSAVEEAKTYLIETSTPGYTMSGKA